MEAFIASITWHHLAFLFALVFVFLFREPLSGLIKRTTKINKDGLTADLSPEIQREQSSTSAEAVQQLLDVVGNSIVISEHEELIRRDLRSKGLVVDGDTNKVLIKHLAGTQILLAFERVHSLIFGSQIYLLKKLNEVAGQGRDLKFVLNHFEHVKGIFPNELGDWNADQYLAYLYSQILITRYMDQFHITNFGVEFLTWMARNGRREDKAL